MNERELAMFPLGSTVFPGQVVPLHVFEPRYRTMLSTLLAPGADPTFGIVLIERGHEVGGGESRSLVATRVEILQAEEFEDGRWGVVTAGVERLNVSEWLEDDPFPRAIVSRREVIDDGGSSLDDLETLLITTLEVAAAGVGIESLPEHEFSADPLQKLDQLSALAPLTEFDRQQILEAPTTSRQIERLSNALEDKLLMLRGLHG